MVLATSLQRTQIECDRRSSISIGLGVEQLPGTPVSWSQAAGMACSEKGQCSGEGRDGACFQSHLKWIATGWGFAEHFA